MVGRLFAPLSGMLIFPPLICTALGRMAFIVEMKIVVYPVQLNGTHYIARIWQDWSDKPGV